MDTSKECCLLNGLHISGSEVYQQDIATLKRYREDYYKITLHKPLRRAGYEAIEGDSDSKHETGKKNTAENEEKLAASLSRTRAAIYELALCNDWEWFVTLTLNPEYHDRKDLNSYKKKLSVWLKNYNRLHKTNIKYLLIPEQHTDGQSWHMHGLMMGLQTTELQEFTQQEKLPIKMIIELAQGNTLYNWPAYAKTFGFVSISKIRDIESVSKYITKYITKNLARTKIELNDHLYYCSQGLKRAEIIYRGPLTQELNEDYSNEYVKVKIVRMLDEATRYFTDSNEAPDEKQKVLNPAGRSGGDPY